LHIVNPKKLSQHIIDKILELRKEYQLGSIRITWYLERYHGIKVSESSVYRTLSRHVEAWENFYNFNRPHGALAGKTPYEVLKYNLK
jgi:hypothetical protein